MNKNIYLKLKYLNIWAIIYIFILKFFEAIYIIFILSLLLLEFFAIIKINSQNFFENN